MPAQPLPFQYQESKTPALHTGFAGLLVFLDAMNVLDLWRAADQSVKLSGEQGWSDGQIIASLVLLNIAGGSHVDDIGSLEADAGLGHMTQVAEKNNLTPTERKTFNGRFRGGRRRAFPSETVIRRYLEKFDDASIEDQRAAAKGAFIPECSEALRGFDALNASIVGLVHKRAPQRVRVATLDQDATLVKTSKSGAKRCYKGFAAYQPLNVYWAEHDLVLHSEFRDGNVPADFEVLRVFRESLKLLPADVEEVKVRADGANYQVEFMKYCAEGRDERFGIIDFAISSDINSAFRTALSMVPEEAWKPLLTRDGEAMKVEQEWAEVCFVPNWQAKTKEGGPTYRFLAVRTALGPQQQLDLNDDSKRKTMTFRGKGTYRVTGTVTNITAERMAGDALIHWHRKRCGASEAAHDVMKDDLAGGTMPSNKFGANAAWWAIMILAFNLQVLVKRVALGGYWCRLRMKALRFAFINVLARIVRTGRRLIIKVAKGHPAIGDLMRARQELYDLS